MKSLNVRRILMSLAAPVLALVVAFVVTSLVLVAVGDPVWEVWKTILAVPKPRQTVNIINAASVFYLSAIAVAVGFRMNLFNIGVDGQYRVAVFAAAVFAGQAWLPGLAQHHRVDPRRDGGRRAVGQHRGIPQGEARRLRGDLDDHAQRHRHRGGELAPAQGGRPQGGLQQHRDQDDPRVLAARGLQAHPGCDQPRLHAADPGDPRRVPLLVRARQDAVRVRPARHRSLRERGRRQWGEGPAHGDDRDDRVRCAGRSGGHAAAVRAGPQLRHDVPVRARLRRHRHRAARSQQRRRHRVRRPAVGVPRRAVQRPADPGRRRPGARQHHPGRHPVRRRHRLRADPPGRQADRADAASRSELAAQRQAAPATEGAPA